MAVFLLMVFMSLVLRIRVGICLFTIPSTELERKLLRLLVCTLSLYCVVKGERGSCNVLLGSGLISETDDPYSIEQLRDPRMNVSIVRPLVDKCYEDQDLSMSKSHLLNRDNSNQIT